MDQKLKQGAKLMSQMSDKRELTPDQRRAKIERDRRRRREHKAEFERLKHEAVSLRNENRNLKEQNHMLSNSKTQGLLEQFQELRGDNRRLLETIKQLNTWIADKFPSPNEEVANNEPITQCLGNSQSAIQFSDELVEDFIKKLDAKEKSNVDFSDFYDLKEEMETSGINSLPPSLAPVDTSIKGIFGEIAADSTQSSCTAMPTRILFCAAIKEMSNLQLNQIDERKILLWRDAINSALNINFKVEFAITHLKKIAHAYFGLKAWNEYIINNPEHLSMEKRFSELEIEKRALEEKYAQKVEEGNSEMMKQCVRGALYFAENFLDTGLIRGRLV